MSRGIPSSVARCVRMLERNTNPEPVRRELATIADRAHRKGDIQLAVELRAISGRPSREAMVTDLTALYKRRWPSSTPPPTYQETNAP